MKRNTRSIHRAPQKGEPILAGPLAPHTRKASRSGARGPFLKVILDPGLQKVAGSLGARDCRKLAEIYRIWGRDLDMKAASLGAQLGGARQAPAEQQPIQEQEGDWITTNCWIKLGLIRSQVKALTLLGKEWSTGKTPCATAARLLISLGLLNEADTESKLHALISYMQAEGFNSLGKYCDGAMAAKERRRK